MIIPTEPLAYMARSECDDWRKAPRASPLSQGGRPWDVDDNRAVLGIIRAEAGSSPLLMTIQRRMVEGAAKYGHGMRVWEDARKYRSKHDSWLEHALQENLDGVVYIASAIARLRLSNLCIAKEKAYRAALLHQVALCRSLSCLISDERDEMSVSAAGDTRMVQGATEPTDE